MRFMIMYYKCVMMKTHHIILYIIAVVALSSCYQMRTSKGGGQVNVDSLREIDASDILLMPGYRIEPVTTELTYPSGAAFDDKGQLHVVEAGYCYGEVWTTPRLIRIDSN